MKWMEPELSRDQMVLFEHKLDDAVDANHRVRLLDVLLERIDFSQWESEYHDNAGRAAIHPRVLAGVILYGMLTRIRTTRGLEEALQTRLDFLWLASGRQIDHTTFSKFRSAHPDKIKNLFVQIGLLARELGLVTLTTLGFDGTRVRANNRRNGTRNVEQLREAKKQLEEEFAQHEQACKDAQGKEDQALAGVGNPEQHRRTEELLRKQEQIDAALEQLKQIEDSDGTVPKTLPITDPESRLMKDKEGSYSPNYTPTVTVDLGSGIIVDEDVLNEANEHRELVPSVNRVRDNFFPDESSDNRSSIAVAADGLMETSENLEKCEEENIELFTPSGGFNPAFRDDLTQPVPEEQRDRLPTRKCGSEQLLDKSAFVYDEKEDCFWCPMGQRLERRSERKTKNAGIRILYRVDKQTCHNCPLRPRCFKNSRDQYGRRVECGQSELRSQAHRQKMQTEQAKKVYARRAESTERPFAVIKQQFGARQFLTRGLDRVRCEWSWLSSAHNLKRLLSYVSSLTSPVGGAIPLAEPP